MSFPLVPDLTRFHEWADAQGKAVLEWFNPDLPYEELGTKGWVGSSFEAFLLANGLYALIIVVGIFLYMSEPKKTAGKSERKEKSKQGLSWGEVVDSFRREPIKCFQVVYNLFQVILCGWMVAATVLIYIEEGYSIACNPFVKEPTRMTYVLWVFSMSKILDFCDTFFMVVRGKWSQFSFLHVYHHFTIYSIYWVVINTAYWGDSYYPIIANGFVHFVMYFYYFLTSFGVNVTWGNMVTQLQLLQFVTMISQGVYMLNNNCEFPTRVNILYVTYISSLFILFLKFYVERWCRPAEDKGKGKEAIAKKTE